MTQQIYTTPIPFSGKDVTIENTGRGYTSNMLIKGQTYQNLSTVAFDKISDFNNINTSINRFEDGYLVANSDTASTGWGNAFSKPFPLIKPNTTYTVIIDVLENTLSKNYVLNSVDANSVSQFSNWIYISTGFVGRKLAIVTSKDDVNTNVGIRSFYDRECSGKIKFRYYILEGDYTNKEVPSSITGIESVGDKENNKISILSHGKNLYKPRFTTWSSDTKGIRLIVDNNNEYITGTATDTVDIRPVDSNVKEKLYQYLNNAPVGSTFTLSNGAGLTNYWNIKGANGSYYYPQDTYTKQDGDTNISCFVRITKGKTFNNVPLKIQITEGTQATSYEPYKEDKKEILLPIEGGLKSLPNGVCDTIEQREDGVYLVQNIGKWFYDGSTALNWTIEDKNENWKFGRYIDNKRGNTSIICDTFKMTVDETLANGAGVKIYTHPNQCELRFTIPKTVLIANNGTITSEEINNWFKTNPTTVYYELATPIETKLDINNLNLETFKDLTYISSENNISPILEFKAPILGYKEINPIQLKTTQNNIEVNVYPYSTPELITFGDNETLADKINNLGNTHKHNNATVTTDGFMSKESYSKLESLTNYTHPSTHAATMITQDTSHRFVTDAEKNNWNAKASTNVATSSTNGLMSNTDKQKIDRISNSFDIVYDANTETIRFRFR